MYGDPFQVSMGTLVGVSAILGHRLEDRSNIREAQDPALIRFVQEESTVPLRDASQQPLFCVAPLDILVTEDEGQKQFHIIELNGTGIGGLTNMSAEAVGCVLEGMQQIAHGMDDPSPLVLIASSGLESEQMPRRNKLIYEKVLYAEAFKRGFEQAGRPAVVTTQGQSRESPWELHNGQPTIVLGYMKEFLRNVEVDHEGCLSLFGRRVSAAVNDRFCLNLVHEFGSKMDMRRWLPINRCYLPGADKAVLYQLLNEYLEQNPTPITRPPRFTLAETREELIETVLDWVQRGLQAVIKPQGTGLGHGIEFFLRADEPRELIVDRIDGSLRLTERFYGLHGGALPYTVCEFLDTAIIRHEGHPMRGHKYELRVVVYRDGMHLKAFPSITKVSSQPYNPEQPSHLSLINNITASALATLSAGVEHMMPLANARTLSLLHLKPEHLRSLCQLATHVVRYVLDQVQDTPEKLGLPAACMV